MIELEFVVITPAFKNRPAVNYEFSKIKTLSPGYLRTANFEFF